MQRLSWLAILLLLTSLACSAANGGTPAPIQGPAPACSTEGYNHLAPDEALVAEIDGKELAEFFYADGTLYIISGNEQNSTPLGEGIHFITFVLTEGDQAIAQAQMKVNICLGEFYYREINITPYQSQGA